MDDPGAVLTHKVQARVLQDEALIKALARKLSEALRLDRTNRVRELHGGMRAGMD